MFWQFVTGVILLVMPLIRPPSVRAASASPPTTAPKIIVHSICTGADQSGFAPGSATLLDEAVQMLKQSEGAIVVEEDAADIGDDNATCAASCAQAVQSYLVRHGVVPSRFTVEVRAVPPSEASHTTADSGARKHCIGTN